MPADKLIIRAAQRTDLEAIVKMLADDKLGSQRERFELPLPVGYVRAFEAIDCDPRQHLVVAEIGGEAAGTLQLSFLPYLTYQGRERALIEAVRVGAGHRGRGIGRQMLEWAIEQARMRGCHLVQLTTDKHRSKALSFYEALGFVASHEGMKLHL